MSYKLYTVEGLVLSSRSASEASTVLSLFTGELGLVQVWVQGAKKSNSKLAPNVQDLSLSRVTLVKGKEYWRLTDAQKIKDFTGLLQDVQKRAVLMRIVQILHRLAHEDVDREAYICTRSFLEHLDTLDAKNEAYELLEILYMRRLLGILGYLDREEEVSDGCSKAMWEDAELRDVGRRKKEYVQSINRALRDSHL